MCSRSMALCGQKINGFLWTAVSLRLTLPGLEDMLDNLIHDARVKVIADDFHMWALKWESWKNNAKHRKVLETFKQLDIALEKDRGSALTVEEEVQ